MIQTPRSIPTLLLAVLTASLRPVFCEEIMKKSPYSIVIDGGSTGSRLHIFQFMENSHTGESECVRMGSERANVPLSAFGRRDDRDRPIDTVRVAQHLMECFEYAAAIIPEEFHLTTSVKYAATAGMRLLEESEQGAVYDALYEGLMSHPEFVFRAMQREDIATLSGELEGFYGAVAANFLVGSIDTQLRTGGSSNDMGPLGALDMGGSSTQIVYMPGCDDCSDEEENGEGSSASYLHEDDFFSTSYLAYGVDQMRARTWDTLVDDHEKENQQNDLDEKIIENPCTFKGYKTEWKGYTLLGTGNSEACVRQVQRLIPHTEPDAAELGGRVGGIEHPKLRGKFFAMSLYFFSLDSLRELSTAHPEAHETLNNAWPNPSIEELYNALPGLCSRDWYGDLAHIQHNSHEFTRAEVLPHRCFESVYLVTLLRDGFGFAPESRDITFTFLVDGSEVEWSLGLALSMHAESSKAAMGMQQAVEANLTEECNEAGAAIATRT